MLVNVYVRFFFLHNSTIAAYGFIYLSCYKVASLCLSNVQILITCARKKYVCTYNCFVASLFDVLVSTSKGISLCFFSSEVRIYKLNDSVSQCSYSIFHISHSVLYKAWKITTILNMEKKIISFRGKIKNTIKSSGTGRMPENANKEAFIHTNQPVNFRQKNKSPSFIWLNFDTKKMNFALDSDDGWWMMDGYSWIRNAPVAAPPTTTRWCN